MVNNPELPTEVPDVEGVSAVKEDATPVKGEIVPTGEVEDEDDDQLLSPEHKGLLTDTGRRIKAAAMRPIKQGLKSYKETGHEVIVGVLEALEGSKKKGK